MSGTSDQLLFSSDRKFVISSYARSHGLLLLRSVKTTANLTRLDILFQDVRAMEIRGHFEGIEIRLTSLATLKEFASNHANQ